MILQFIYLLLTEESKELVAFLIGTIHIIHQFL